MRTGCDAPRSSLALGGSRDSCVCVGGVDGVPGTGLITLPYKESIFISCMEEETRCAGTGL